MKSMNSMAPSLRVGPDADARTDADMIAGIRGREPDTVQRLVVAIPRHSGG